MTDIGPTLREARMRDGWDISEVEDRTKIRAKYLRALENEEWSLLPGPTYTKGFLRSYAEALGLDGRMLVDEYKRQWEAPNELDVVPVRPTVGIDSFDGDRGGHRLRRWGGAALLVVALAVAGVLIGDLGSSPSTPPSKAPPLGASGATQHVAPLTSCVPGSTGYVAASCASLRIEPRVASLYVCLIADKRIRIDGRRLAPGTPRVTYRAHRFIVTLGSSAATLVIDAHRFVVPAANGPVRYEIARHVRKLLAAPHRLRCRS